MARRIFARDEKRTRGQDGSGKIEEEILARVCRRQQIPAGIPPRFTRITQAEENDD
jgi:hypothetical protein